MQANCPSVRYVLLTPARNEEAFIGRTIESVLAQTLKPLRWVIIDDGSSDRTREIIQGYLPAHSFIRMISVERKGDRNWGQKAAAFAQGVANCRDLQYDFIGNLDADISLEPDFYEGVFKAFASDLSLGLAGGIVYNKFGERWITWDNTLDSVGGQTQMFRKACYEQFGGYPRLRYGGIDVAAEVTARMQGWKVRKFTTLKAFEHRLNGTAQASLLRARMVEGRRFHSVGYGFLFYSMRCLYRSAEKPFLLGGLAAWWGFVVSCLLRRPIQLPPNVVRYLRREQRQRMLRACTSWIGFSLHSPRQEDITNAVPGK
jgi:biofilm PGA synthesis N-glycosyltransferase PgaC